MLRVVHFAIEAENTARAMEFYKRVFGWTFNSWGPPEMDYHEVITGPDSVPGINGGLMKRTFPPNQEGKHGYHCTIDVPSIEEYAERVKLYGGKFVEPKHALKGIGWHAMCIDTEGNTFGLIENNPKVGL